MEPNNNSTPQPGPAPQPEPTPQSETTPEPITSTPPTPTISQPITPTPNTPPQLPKSKRKKPIPTIILACTTAIFAGFAVFFGYQYLSSDQANNSHPNNTNDFAAYHSDPQHTSSTSQIQTQKAYPYHHPRLYHRYFCRFCSLLRLPVSLLRPS